MGASSGNEFVDRVSRLNWRYGCPRRPAPKALRHACFMEAASASATLQKDVAQGCVWIDRARKLRKPKSTAAVEGAIAMCESRFADALKKWAEALDYLVRNKLDSCLARLARASITAAGLECRRAIS